MASPRAGWVVSLVLALPLPFLLLYLLGVPLPLPGLLLPERAYVAYRSAASVESLLAARGGAREAFALGAEGLLPLPAADAGAAAWSAFAARLPERPVLDAFLTELAEAPPPFRRLRLALDFVPTAGEFAALRAAARAARVPLTLDLPDAEAPRSDLMAYARRLGATGDAFAFELLFWPEAVRAERLQVRALREGGAEVLWEGGGAALPADHVLRASASRAGLLGLEVLVSRNGRETRLDLAVEPAEEETARVLVITEKAAPTSFIETVAATRRVDLAAARSLDLADFELVVLDGLALSRLDGRLGEDLAGYARRRVGSVLFVADSPDFGSKGDNPLLEDLLPLTLVPPSLKDLPDMAMLLLLDYSGSMFGDKLSLGKVASLELLRGLKPTDRVGLLLFSDRRGWVWDFPENRSISAAPVLEPVEAEGGTELALALEEGLARLGTVGMAERHIVVISDGVTRPADFDALAARAKAAGISISTFGVGPDQDRGLLEKLAARSGGRYYPVASADAIPALLFEDRVSQARPRFAEGRIPVLDFSGAKVATIGGMAQYAVKEGASVLFANEVGDPLWAERLAGNRAVLAFTSDLYGTYTADFFGRPGVAALLRDRLESLFASRPPEIAVLEGARSAALSLRSPALVAPRLRLTRAGMEPRDFELIQAGPETWTVETVVPATGLWRAVLFDRGSAVASFTLAFSQGPSGQDVASLAAAAAFKDVAWSLIRAERLWLLLFFLSSLGATLVLRLRR